MCAAIGAVNSKKNIIAIDLVVTETSSGNIIAAQINNNPTPSVDALTVTERRK
jgi:hypothetical protein